MHFWVEEYDMTFPKYHSIGALLPHFGDSASQPKIDQACRKVLPRALRLHSMSTSILNTTLQPSSPRLRARLEIVLTNSFSFITRAVC